MVQYEIYEIERKLDVNVIINSFQVAANEGSPDAAWKLYLIFNGNDQIINNKKDEAKSFEALILAAENGKDEAQFKVGMECKETSSKKACEWLEKSAKQGNVKAKYNLGLLHLESNHISDAKKWFLDAANNGYKDAMYQFGIINIKEGNLDEAKKWIKEAAERNHINACYEYGMLCLDDENTEEALKWLNKAGDLNHKDALYELGVLAEKSGDIEKAKEFFSKANHQETSYELYRLNGFKTLIPNSVLFGNSYDDNGIRALLAQAKLYREKNKQNDPNDLKYIKHCEDIAADQLYTKMQQPIMHKRDKEKLEDDINAYKDYLNYLMLSNVYSDEYVNTIVDDKLKRIIKFGAYHDRLTNSDIEKAEEIMRKTEKNLNTRLNGRMI